MRCNACLAVSPPNVLPQPEVWREWALSPFQPHCVCVCVSLPLASVFNLMSLAWCCPLVKDVTQR